jgi:hypothetical protein
LSILIIAILEIVAGLSIFSGGPLAIGAAVSAMAFGFLMLALAGILNEAQRIRRSLQRREHPHKNPQDWTP